MRTLKATIEDKDLREMMLEANIAFPSEPLEAGQQPNRPHRRLIPSEEKTTSPEGMRTYQRGYYAKRRRRASP